MGETIDELEIRVETKASQAQEGLNDLADKLEKLKGAVKGGYRGLDSAATAVDKLKAALGGVDASKTQALASLAESVKALDGVKVSSTVAKQMEGIVGAVKGLDGVSESSLDKVAKIAAALKPLSGVQGNSGLTSTITQLGRIRGVADQLRGIDFAAFSSDVRQLTSALAPLVAQMRVVGRAFANLPQNLGRTQTAMRNVAGQAKTAGKSMREASTGAGSFASKLEGVLNLAAGGGVFGLVTAAISNVGSTLGYCVNQSNKYVEDLNLFTVSLGEYARTAQVYAENVSAVLGIDPAQWLRNQGVFQSMVEGFGVASDKAIVMSRNLTQLSYDISSFANLPVEEAFTKVQSGIAGELEPLRRLGYDLSVARLQQEALNLGIQDNVSYMTQAEKAQLRYLAIMRQLPWVQGDMARTLIAPANQLRILQASFVQAARSVGNVFIPALNALLPPVIAVMQVIRKLADMLASFFGFALPEIDYGNVSDGFAAGSDAADGLGDAVGGVGDAAGGAAKELEKMKDATLGFDELNVVKENEPSGGGAGGGGGGGGGGAGGGGFDFEVPNYDFLAGLAQAGIQDMVDAIMDGVFRAADLFAPFGERFGQMIAKMKEQASGLDFADALSDSFWHFFEMVAAAANETVGIVAPVIEALNVPQIVYDSIRTADALFLSLRDAIGFAGAGMRGFVSEGIIPMAEWVGGKLHDAFLFAQERLGDWAQWFRVNTPSMQAFGDKCGEVADAILGVIRWIGDAAWNAFKGTLTTLQEVAQLFFGAIINNANITAPLITGVVAAFTGMKVLQTVQGWAGMFMSGMDGATDKTGKLETAWRSLGGFCSPLTNLLKGANEKLRGMAESAGLVNPKITDMGQVLSSVKGTLSSYSNLIDAGKNACANMAGASILLKDAISGKIAAIKADAVAQGQSTIAYVAGIAKTKLLTLATSGLSASEKLHRSTTVASTIATIAQNAAFGLLGVGATVAKGAVQMLNAAFMANPIGFVITAITALLPLLQMIPDAVNGILNAIIPEREELKALTDETSKAVDSHNDLMTSIGDSVDEAKSSADSLKRMGDRVAELGAKTNISATEQAELQRTLEKLRSEVPGVTAEVDDFGNITGQSAETVRELVKTAANGNLAESLGEQANEAEKDMNVLKGSVEELQAKLDAGVDPLAWFDVKNALDEASDSLAEATAKHEDLEKQAKEAADAAANEAAQQRKLKSAFSDFKTILAQCGDENRAYAEAAAKAGLSEQDLRDYVVQANEDMAAASEQAKSDMIADIEEYCDANPQFRKQLADSGTSVDEFAQHLMDSGMSMDDFESGVADMVDSATDGLHNLKNDQGITLKEYQQNLTDNADAVRGWGESMTKIMTTTGLDSSDAWIKSLQDMGVDQSALIAEIAAMTPEDMKALSEAYRVGGEDAKQTFMDVLGLDEVAAQALADTNQVVENSKLPEATGNEGAEMTQEFADGATGNIGVVEEAATTIRNAAVQSLNGGDGYHEAFSAGANLGGGYFDGLATTQDGAYGAAVAILSAAVQGLGSGYNRSLDAGKNLGGGFGDGISSVSSVANSKGRALMQQAVNGMGSGYAKAVDAGRNLGGGFGDGIAAVSSTVNSKGKALMQQAVSGMGSGYGNAVSAGKNLGGGFGDGINATKSNAYWCGVGVKDNAVSGMGSGYWNAYDAGKNLAYGFSDGMRNGSATGAVAESARNIVRTALNAANRESDSHSPSRLFADEAGKWLPLGAAAGVDENSGALVASVEAMMRAASAKASSMTAQLALIAVEPNVDPSGLVLSDADIAVPSVRRALDVGVAVGGEEAQARAVEEQNALLRDQNEIMRRLLEEARRKKDVSMDGAKVGEIIDKAKRTSGRSTSLVVN